MEEKYILQRLNDFSELADNKEVRLLANIVSDYIKSSKNTSSIGFINKSELKKQAKS